MTTIVWTVSTIDYNIVDGTKVPTVLHWRANGDDGQGNTGRYIGTQAVTQSPERANVTWDNLTEDKALAWLMADMSVVTMDTPEGEPVVSQKDSVEAYIDAQIAEKANPTRGTGLPWSNGGLIEKFEHEIATMPAPEVSTMPAGDES